MITEDRVRDVIGSTLYDSDGDKVGKVGQLYLDDATGRPEWVTVSTGFFGTRESFVPLGNASFSDDGLSVPFSKDKIKDAPNVDLEADGHLSEDQEAELYRYYGLESAETGYSGQVTDTSSAEYAAAGTGSDRDSDGYDTSGPETDDAMTRSEERINVGTQRQEAGRARLRKYVVTEQVQQTVPVRREEVRVEREPITEANRDAALSGPAISEEEHEVVLHEERPVVEKEAVPVERVRLSKETVEDAVTVQDEVRKEQIETDGDADRVR